MYYLSEIFESIQGEGNCTGIRSLFVRFGHCNLACLWCDSKFTWSKNVSESVKTAEEIKQLISQSTAPNVIFTGGEPALYALDKLVVAGKKFHVETNGTIVPTLPLEIVLPNKTVVRREAMNETVIQHFNWVVSPKMRNANQQLNHEAMLFWAGKDWGIFKFIIQNEADLAEIEEIADDYQIPAQRVYVGLEGCTLASQLRPDLVESIMQKDYNFSPRLHVILWGNERKK